MRSKTRLRAIPSIVETTPPRRSTTTVTVVFGPSRSRFFDRALEHARAGGARLRELSPGRFRARFMLGRDPAAFAHVAALCGLVRRWRGSEFGVDGEPVLGTLVWEMGFCASDQLVANGRCQMRFEGVVPDRCDACPLFDPTRARGEHVRSSPGHRPWAGSAGAVLDLGSSIRRARRVRLVSEQELGVAPARFTLRFGPSRSWDLQRALARATEAADELSPQPDGSYRAEFVLAEDPERYLAVEGILRLLVLVRGTELLKDGLPVPLSAVYVARQRLRSIYAVPPPRDLVALIADDLTGGVRPPHPSEWGAR